MPQRLRGNKRRDPASARLYKARAPVDTWRMLVPDKVLVDYSSPFPELCERLLESAGLSVQRLDSGWPGGMTLVRWLDASTAPLFATRRATAGPVMAIVDAQSLRADDIALAAGSAHSYSLSIDPPEVLRATLLSGFRRWDTDRRLEESESRFRFIAENAGDVIWTWNMRTRRYEFISPSIKQLRGLGVAEALAEPMERSMRPESFNKSMAQLAQGLVEYRRTGSFTPLTDVYEQPHADGTVRHVEITTTFLLDADGEPEKLLGVSRDATERVSAERALKAALEERDTLLKELGHRIKNTLAMTGSLLSLAQGMVRDPDDATLFEESRARVQAMAVLYDRLLHSRSQSSIGLGDYLGDLCSALADAYAHADGLSLVMDVTGVEVDSRRAVSLGLAVNEAVTNALKYAAVPGRPLTLRIASSRRHGGESFDLSIADDGAGLPAGFDPAAGGGLGFLLIRSLAEQLGAGLEVRSAPGQGTELRIGPISA